MELKGALNPNKPIFSLIISSILAQNTNYFNAKKALENLIAANIIDDENPNKSIKSLLALDVVSLASLIKTAGFYNQKAPRILKLVQNIKQDFGSFETFSKDASYEWLIEQKGIGNESALAILNYALKKEVLVIDKYTIKLLGLIGYECEDAQSATSFLTKDIQKAKSLYDFDISLAQLYARLHGKIVEFGKANKALFTKKLQAFD
ncbi:hypothetical protein BKH40_08160 [Helicobacter sp. 11S02629-2]|nr:hypothetical protein BKH40_08160 [Helicobacter sp. 11S02629-2]